jgi:membrane-associated phospholipid phosphatase
MMGDCTPRSVAGSVVILMLVFGPALVVLTPLVALVGWARIEVGDHTPVEVLVGAAIGASVFQLLR